MAKKKIAYYDFPDLFRSDKLDDYIFSFISGVRSVAPNAKLQNCALEFQKFMNLTEDQCALDIILASYHRSIAKYQKFTQIDNDFFHFN